MIRVPILLRKTLDSLVVTFGVCLGIFLLAVAGDRLEIANGFEQADRPFVCTVALVGAAVLLSSLVATRSRKWPAPALFAAAVIAAIGFARSWTQLGNPGPRSDFFVDIIVILAAIAGPGVFLLLTHRAEWPSLLRPRPVSVLRGIGTLFVVSCFLYLAICIVIIFFLTRPLSFSPGCGGYPSLVFKQQGPTHAALVAKVVLLGYPQWSEFDRTMSAFAVARIQQRFWGLPRHTMGIVLLPQGVYDENELNFIDGYWLGGWLTLGLPIVTPKPCGISCRLRDPPAQAEIRVLEHQDKSAGVRIIGLVQGSFMHASEPAAGVGVVVKGPDGNMNLSTDPQGIFDAVGLSPGHYSVAFAASGEPTERTVSCSFDENHALNAGEVWGCRLFIRERPPLK